MVKAKSESDVQIDNCVVGPGHVDFKAGEVKRTSGQDLRIHSPLIEFRCQMVNADDCKEKSNIAFEEAGKNLP